MNKAEFLSQLTSNLSNIPVEEVKNAVSYYSEYIDDAGIEREEQVIKRLGAPSKVAADIIANYAINDLKTSPKSAKTGLSNMKLVTGALFKSSKNLVSTLIIFIVTFLLIFSAISIIASIGISSLIALIYAFICFGSVVSAISDGTGFIILLLLGTGILFIGIALVLLYIFIILNKYAFGWIARLVGKFLLRRDKHGSKQQ